ncbi:zinc-binding dehydrogenase [Streptomyces diastatochromogenes]|nr:zinc-binding dehydrogenase [Streptomyces diastatochromogenes]
MTGASAVVGRLAVQYAHAAGLRVVAVAHEGDEPELRVIGADHVVPRGIPEDIVAKVRAGDPDGVDGVFDGALVGEALLPVLKDGGVFAALAPTGCRSPSGTSASRPYGPCRTPPGSRRACGRWRTGS